MASYHRRRSAAQIAVTRAEPAALLMVRHDGWIASAFALVTFSVVPFVGVLFCPAALLLGLFCLVRRLLYAPRTGSRRAEAALALAVFISGLQIALWWMLVHVPDWTGQF